MAQVLSDEEIGAGLEGSEWTRDGEAITRELTFEDFAGAIAFVDRVAQAAEEAGHHPDILVHGYQHVRLSLCTHSAGGITEADLRLARRLDALS